MSAEGSPLLWGKVTYDWDARSGTFTIDVPLNLSEWAASWLRANLAEGLATEAQLEDVAIGVTPSVKGQSGVERWGSIVVSNVRLPGPDPELFRRTLESGVARAETAAVQAAEVVGPFDRLLRRGGEGPAGPTDTTG